MDGGRFDVIDRSPGGRDRRGRGRRLAATAVVVLGLLAGLGGTGRMSAQPAEPVPTGTPVAFIELRVHSCPDDFAGTGFYQHLTQCTSERGLYGVGMGVTSGGLAPQFRYSAPDETGRAALMEWWAVTFGDVTVTEVAPDPIKPSAAFCSLQPAGGGPLTMDGDAVPLENGVMTITLTAGDTLMCDWYRWPGGVTAGDEDGDDGQAADRDGDGLFDDDETAVYGTDPDVADTDGDGVSDGAEVYFGTDPLVANEATTRADTDEDGLYDDDETDIYTTDPATFDTDGDGVGDGEEVYVGTDPTVADDGNGGNPPANPPANPPTNPPANPGGGDNNGDDLDANCLDPEEAIFLTRLNDLRQAIGAPPVRVSGTLNKAADAHSRDMGVRDFTAHTNPDGITDQQRILAAGYVPGNPYRLAENIFWGDETGRGAFAWWEASPGHKANMINPELVAIGIARVNVPGSTHGWYWTTTHANQADAVPEC